MGKLRLYYLSIFFFFFHQLNILSQNSNFVVKGEIDLQNDDFNKNPVVKLDGDWDFYWKNFIPAEDFMENVQPKRTDYFTLPALWNSFIVNGNKISGIGFATYHVRVKIKDPNKIYTLKLNRISSAYKLWVDDQLLIQVGRIDTIKENTVPSWEVKRKNFLPKRKEFDITIQVANFHHRKGGIANSIVLGTEEAMKAAEHKTFGFSVFILGILIIIAIHHLGLYFLNKKEKSALYFAFLSLTTALYILTRGEFLINNIVGVLPFELNVKLNWWAILFGLLSFSWFTYTSFTKYYNNKTLKILNYGLISFSLLILILPAIYFTPLIFLVFLFAIFTPAFSLLGMAKAAIKKEPGARLATLGIFILFLAAVNDILNDMGNFTTFIAIPYGIFIFILIESFMLALRSSLAQKKVESMNAKIETLDRIKGRLLNAQNFKISTSIKILTQELGYSKGYLIFREDESLYIQAGFDSEAKHYTQRLPETISLDNSVENHQHLPMEFIISKIKNYNPSEEKNLKNMTLSKSYFESSKAKSALVYPLIENDEIQSLLYFESKKENNVEKRSLLSLLESQILTLIENSQIFEQLEELNRTLEEKVEQRTAEVYQQKEEIAAQRDEIEEKNQRLKIALDQKEYVNRTLTDSINYARRIQQSLLPSHDTFTSVFPDSFVFLRPKDILSGDFYWIKEMTRPVNGKLNNYKIIAAIDCTGHGVPGALMSIIANDLLEQAINENELIAPAQILESMEKGLKLRLQSDKNSEKNKDGMDMSLVVINTTTKEYRYSGAHNPIYYLPNGTNEIEVLQPTPYSIGGFEVKNKIKSFNELRINYKAGETIYLFSDGYYDQIGGLKGRKFMKKAFRNLILTNSNKTMQEQHSQLQETFISWKATLRQIDDILVIGIKL